MRVTNRELAKIVERWEHDKPLIVQWTKHDEKMLSIAKELLKFRKYKHPAKF